MNATTSPRIYVACLASYNNGVLHGEWIDADQSVTAIREAIATMLRRSPFPNVVIPCPACEGCSGETRLACSECKGVGTIMSAEEYAVHDYDGFYGALGSNEYPDLDNVAAIASGIEEHGEAFALYMANIGSDTVDTDAFQDAYAGEWDSVEAFAENLLSDTGQLDELPEWARNYFDMHAYARDLELGGDIWTARDSDHALHIFWNR